MNNHTNKVIATIKPPSFLFFFLIKKCLNKVDNCGVVLVAIVRNDVGNLVVVV
jgi:uncharacterized phage infection (PIP) family protein YhgE